MVRAEEDLPRLPCDAERRPILSECFTTGFVAHVQVRWYGSGGCTPGGGGRRESTATIPTGERRERLRPASDGDDPWTGEVEVPYLPTEFGWEAGEEVLNVRWLVTLFGREWD